MKIPALNFTQCILLMLLFSFIQIYVIHVSEIVYVPMFFVLVFSFTYGLLQPRRGWILAIFQVLILVGAYWALKGAGITARFEESAVFATHVSIFPSFAASFLGSFIRRL